MESASTELVVHHLHHLGLLHHHRHGVHPGEGAVFDLQLACSCNSEASAGNVSKGRVEKEELLHVYNQNLDRKRFFDFVAIFDWTILKHYRCNFAHK